MQHVNALTFNQVLKAIPHTPDKSTLLNRDLAFEKHQINVMFQQDKQVQKPADQVIFSNSLAATQRIDAGF